MRVLLVAPSTGLAYAAEEVQAVVNTAGLSVRLLQGSVNERDVIEALRQRVYDCLWLATHGNRDGVLLSDGALLSTSALTALVRSHAIPFVFLNTCESLQTAMQINQEAQADVVATVLEVPDAEAYRTGALLAYHLGKGEATRDAYEASKPGGNRTYVYLGKSTRSRQTDGDAPTPIEHRVSTLERDVRRLWGVIRPSPRQMTARLLFWGLLVALWSMWMIKEVRDWLIAFPFQAIAITLALIIAALIIRWLPEDEHHD
jgi:hypothetical protein